MIQGFAVKAAAYSTEHNSAGLIALSAYPVSTHFSCHVEDEAPPDIVRGERQGEQDRTTTIHLYTCIE